MDVPLVITRFIHVLSGAFWVGAAIYLALILEPRVRSIGPQLEGQLLNLTSKLNSAWITGAAVVTMLSGFALVSMTPGRSFSQLGSNAWGNMILTGLILSLAAFFISGGAGVFSAKLRRGLDAGNVSTDELDRYRRNLSRLSYLNAVIVTIAVATMAAARFT
ncbi:MAG: hypothetical protein ACPHK0_05875 [Dehalococcoidia bacterium]